jgi:hypothetical protein
MYKPYDPELQHFDNAGRDIVKAFIQKTSGGKIVVEDNPDQYGVDLVMKKRGEIIGYAEVEVRVSWKGKVFPFPDLNVPSRKAKLLKNKAPTYFFSINNDHTAMFFCEGGVILDSPKKMSPNRFLSEELFFKVPLSKLRYVDLEKINN